MGRIKVSRNISKDEERGLYYVCLNWGKDKAGKYIKTYETTTSKAHAKEILKKHKTERAAGKTVLPSKITVPEATEKYIDYKELYLAETTIFKKEILFHRLPVLATIRIFVYHIC